MKDLLIQMLTFGGFLVLQAVFQQIEHLLDRKTVHRQYLVWLLHPTVIHSVHDWGIFFISELHNIVHF